VAASLLAWVLPAADLAWLGVVPVALGASLLLKRKAQGDEEAPMPPSGVLPVAAVTVANGADNLGVYIPLFATSTPSAIAVMGVTFAAMTALWCWAARWLVRHPAAGAPLRRQGPRAVPYVLVGIGLWILLR
jgi:cadmium resistance protein CadD (predicted permease)